MTGRRIEVAGACHHSTPIHALDRVAKAIRDLSGGCTTSRRLPKKRSIWMKRDALVPLPH
jgi:hypothetical protein